MLNAVFKIADDQGLLLLDLKDLQAMLQYAAANAKEFQTQYGNISAASVGAMQRGLLSLEQQGGDKFLGQPALNLDDLMQTDTQGHGVVNILAADKLINSPQLYATFLLWLLSELFERLPEVGDPEKPKLVFFFDEAHLLFSDLPKVIEDKVHQVVRLVRSKGVGVFFVTQSPIDVPDGILGQLGNRVQHAVRAFTPKDQKAVKAAAQTFRPNPEVNVEQVILELGVGEGLVSFLDEKGTPRWWNAHWFARLAARSARLLQSNGSRSCAILSWLGSTRRSSTANRLMNCLKTAPPGPALPVPRNPFLLNNLPQKLPLVQ